MPCPECLSDVRIAELEAENTRLKGELEEAREALRVVGVQLGDMAALTDSPALAAFCRALIARTQSTPVAEPQANPTIKDSLQVAPQADPVREERECCIKAKAEVYDECERLMLYEIRSSDAWADRWGSRAAELRAKLAARTEKPSEGK